MPSPPPAGQEFVVSIAIPGPVASKTEMENFDKFKKECNELAARYGARVTHVHLQPKP